MHAASEWAYHFRQGRDEHDARNVRHQLNGRLHRSGGRLQAGGWTRLLLGDDFTTAPAKKQLHVLRFVMAYCPCINCKVEALRGDLGLVDVDEMLKDAEQGEGLAEGERVQWRRRIDDIGSDPLMIARRGAQFGRLPSIESFEIIGENLGSHEFELGTVSKISGRGCRVTFSPFAKLFVSGRRYCGPLQKSEISQLVGEKAKEHYRVHKGKTERRFYVHGTLVQFNVDGCGVALKGLEDDTTEEIAPIGVLFRKQVMSVFIGKLALEDSFGSFIQTEASFFMGFSQDPEGAQTVFSDGTMGEPRHLGINELRTHVDICGGTDLEVLLR